MAAIIQFTILDERGNEILDLLEEETEQRSRKVSGMVREYFLIAKDAGVDGFDATLDRIAPDWRDHIGR
ncbi:MAG: hypothetical protein R2725_13440 [Solirubrobacterales bacterium]